MNCIAQKTQNAAFLAKKVTMEGIPKNEMVRPIAQAPVKMPGNGTAVGISPSNTAGNAQNDRRQGLPPIRKNSIWLDPIDEQHMTRVL
ncbi:MAG: hypothetical protein N3G22_05085 [Candidatus Micrarchaeota archaeon]|nr:hypothetical protein [Candidatus Micrarchaeota archaeon]